MARAHTHRLTLARGAAHSVQTFPLSVPTLHRRPCTRARSPLAHTHLLRAHIQYTVYMALTYVCTLALMSPHEHIHSSHTHPHAFALKLTLSFSLPQSLVLQNFRTQ